MSPLAIAVPNSFSLAYEEAVSSETFNNIKRYTDFASAAYADNCARPPYGSVAVKYFSDASTDTQATLFRDDAAKEVIISFRGTSTPQDISVDFDFPLTALTAVGTKCPSCQVLEAFLPCLEHSPFGANGLICRCTRDSRARTSLFPPL